MFGPLILKNKVPKKQFINLKKKLMVRAIDDNLNYVASGEAKNIVALEFLLCRPKLFLVPMVFEWTSNPFDFFYEKWSKTGVGFINCVNNLL
ncbi:hypothetical protein HanIR_Chr11g0538741 [Helianthus annuus]|nr:hypothetical protein HanIR_Chr11g0538741 [Helianthus annuus]